MPLQSGIQEQGFRSSLFGFDKDDVLAYISTLAEQAQQQEAEYRSTMQQMQKRLDDALNEQQTLEDQNRDLRERLKAQTTRAEEATAQLETAQTQVSIADQDLADAKDRAAALEKRLNASQTNQQATQQAAAEWQLKCSDLQEQLDEAQKQLQEAHQPQPPVAQPSEEARLEARRILADARQYAQSAEAELQQRADEQKARMAENARGIATGVLVLRNRLARVDERLDAATLDLEQVTASIYQALDEVEKDLRGLSVEMKDFATGTPESTLPEKPPRAPEPPARPKATAKPVRRLRSAHQKPVSQLLQEIMDRLDQE